MSNDDLIKLAKEAGFRTSHGCKTRNDLESDDCHCDKDGNCTQDEIVGFILPLENLEMFAKFASLIEAKQSALDNAIDECMAKSTKER